MSTETAVFIATTHEKTDMAVIQIGIIVSIILTFLLETLKNK